MYYSHWGAESFVQTAFFGPDAAIEFIRSGEEVDWIVHEVRADAGAVCDIDSRRLSYFCNHTHFHPELRQILLPLMQSNWPGWQLRWAHSEIVEIANLIGYDATELRDTVTYSDSSTEAPELTNPPRYYVSLCTVKAGSVLRDLAFEDCLTNLLEMGPSLLDAVRGWETADLSGQQRVTDLDEGAYIDQDERQISLWTITGRYHEPYLDIIKARWPGWTIEIYDDRLPGHWSRTGRDPAIVQVGEPNILQQISTLLLQDSTFDPQKFLDRVAARGGKVEQIHPNFFDVPQPTIRTLDRAAMLARTIAEYRRRPTTTGTTA